MVRTEKREPKNQKGRKKKKKKNQKTKTFYTTPISGENITTSLSFFIILTFQLFERNPLVMTTFWSQTINRQNGGVATATATATATAATTTPTAGGTGAGTTTSTKGMITPTPFNIDINNDLNDFDGKFIETFKPDLELQKKYRLFIQREGALSFLRTEITQSMSKRDICVLILNLGYPKKAVEDYPILTLKELAYILLKLMLTDSAQLEPKVEIDENDNKNDGTNNSDIDSNSDMDLQLELGELDDAMDVDDSLSENEDEYDQDMSTTTLKRTINMTPFKYKLPDLISDLSRAKKIMVVTGAGISTSLGIPDFRSFKGLYNQLSKLNLSDPQKVFDLQTFMREPGLFYTIAHLVLPPDGKFSLLHAFLKLLQDKHKLLRNYTQNIDNLEQRAGLKLEKLVQCHGSFAKAKCVSCQGIFAGEKIYNHIRRKQVPRCAICWKNTKQAPIHFGAIKPTITFFGEDLPERFHTLMDKDLQQIDLFLVIGTSLKVEPVASIIERVPYKVPKILINKDPIPNRGFNLQLLGLCDDVVSYLCKCLKWDIPHADFNNNDEFKLSKLKNGDWEIVKKSTSTKK